MGGGTTKRNQGGKPRKGILPGESYQQYQERRARNNTAVKASRDKAKKKRKETERKVEELKLSNAALIARIEILRNTLSKYKEQGMVFLGVDIDRVLKDTEIQDSEEDR